jgi:hypothetical protein
MNKELPRFIMPALVLAEIRRIVAQTPEGLETGVALLGARRAGYRTALYAIGPGPEAIRSAGLFEPDIDYLNVEIRRLVAEHPSLEWIGSLHVHPFGMSQLSGTDRSTLAKILGNTDLRFPDFVAGIIQRQRSRLAIYPYLIHANDQFPWLLPVEIHSNGSLPVKTAERQVRRVPVTNNVQPAQNSTRTPNRLNRILTWCSMLRGRIWSLLVRTIQFKRREFHERQSN